jgi:DNA-binding MarR family transcriptional regulator
VEKDPGREAWGFFFELAMENRARLLEALEALDLTFMQSHVLRLLDPGKPRPMGELADTLKCDASNITGIVDRLEARGLVERRSSPGDRRVKALSPTPAGLEMRGRVLDALLQPPPAIEALSLADKRALRDIMRRASGR